MVAMNQLLNSSKRQLLLFGGKGGVGKTSIAASAAIYAAEQGKKTLIISSDPAHSLADVFDQESIASGKIEQVRKIKNLFALEINPKEVLSEYQPYLDNYPAYKFIMGELLEDFPGSNEGFGLLNIIRMYRYADYDLIIVDTAPTGHTLRLLSFPDFLKQSMIRFIKIRHAVGAIFGKITGVFRRKNQVEDQSDPVELLERMRNWAIDAKEWLTKEETQFIIVMIPELLSIYETQRLIKTLRDYQIRIGGLIVNKLFPLETNCEFCRAKRTMQEKYLQVIRQEFADLHPKTIPFLKSEIHGINSLRFLSQCWL
ncbi:MAG: ArsA family ATPase [Candidatus Helarchaeota archaeon]